MRFPLSLEEMMFLFFWGTVCLGVGMYGLLIRDGIIPCLILLLSGGVIFYIFCRMNEWNWEHMHG